MEQEFITSRGKVFLNNQRLLIQNFKSNFQDTVIGELATPLLILALAVFSFFDPKKPFSYFATIIFLIWLFSFHLKQLYSTLFKKSFSNYIPLDHIKFIELKPDQLGLETEVILHLKNGRYRSLLFRTLEKQFESFTESLSLLITQPQLI